MHDAHVHLDFMSNGEQVAADAQAAGAMLFANTVTPDGHEAALSRFEAFENVRVGWGMHPWWVSSENANPAIPDDARFIGEIGLDFSKRHIETRGIQLAAFGHIARACAEQGRKVLSIHSVHAAREVLDVLEAHGTLESCTCIFHWYTGPSDQLKRAIDRGCYFSAGPRMLATAKGREYVKAIPLEQLLVETDAPPSEGSPYSFEELSREINAAIAAIAAIKGNSAPETMDETFANLFN